MSWFSTGLDKLTQLSETVQKASESVTQAIPLDREFLAKLTLNTDEMKAERQHFGEEAAHKEEVKDMLSSLLPWETRDVERDILVEECREAILALSTNEETFFGPFEMPAMPVKVIEQMETSKTEDGDGVDEDDDDDDDEEEHGQKVRKPSEKSLEQLAKLEPLPPLLSQFDLDSHVGLIQRILNEDPNLVKVQSTLSGGGAREKVFWHNYFFHCAFTRYEAGLSIDEIWSFAQQQGVEGEASVDPIEEAAAAEETVVFDESGEKEENPTETAFPASENAEETEILATGSEEANFAESDDASPESSSGFELVDETGEGGIGDPELDELEAEIARELED